MDACPGDGHAAARPRGRQAAGPALRYPECTFPFRGSPPRRPVPGSDPASLILSGRAPARPLPCRYQPHLSSPVPSIDENAPSIHRMSCRSIDSSSILISVCPSIDSPSILISRHRSIDGPSILILAYRSIDGSSILILLYRSIDGPSILISRRRLIDGSSILILGHRFLFWAVDPYSGPSWAGRAVERYFPPGTKRR